MSLERQREIFLPWLTWVSLQSTRTQSRTDSSVRWKCLFKPHWSPGRFCPDPHNLVIYFNDIHLEPLRCRTRYLALAAGFRRKDLQVFVGMMGKERGDILKVWRQCFSLVYWQEEGSSSASRHDVLCSWVPLPLSPPPFFITQVQYFHYRKKWKMQWIKEK